MENKSRRYRIFKCTVLSNIRVIPVNRVRCGWCGIRRVCVVTGNSGSFCIGLFYNAVAATNVDLRHTYIKSAFAVLDWTHHLIEFLAIWACARCLVWNISMLIRFRFIRFHFILKYTNSLEIFSILSYKGMIFNWKWSVISPYSRSSS